jgi:hypothetical protein
MAISPEQRNWIAEFFFALSKLCGINWLKRIVWRAKSCELARKNPALKVCVWRALGSRWESYEFVVVWVWFGWLDKTLPQPTNTTMLLEKL